MRRATLFFFDLKNQPRFKNSAAIQNWKRDFLSHPDLKAVNDRYRKDGDAIRFMVDMTQSPNFQGMVKEYLGRPDARAFIRDMTAAKEVQDSADSFLEDVNIGAAVERIRSAVPPAETDAS